MVSIKHVGARYVVVVMTDDPPLPDGACQQNRRKNEIDEFVGDEDDAEGDDDEPDDDEGSIDAKRTDQLAGLDPEQEGDEDDTQQPCVLGEQAARHDEEVLVPRQSDELQCDGEDKYRALGKEVLCAETGRQRLGTEVTQHHGSEGEDGHRDE